MAQGPTGRPVVNVGLLWHSMASGNLGVVALTVSQIAIVRAAAEEAGVVPRLVVLGWRADGSLGQGALPQDVEYVAIDAKGLANPFSALRAKLTECQVVLDVGEGDSFSDIYGLKRLAYLCFSKRIAAANGRVLLLSPQTLGPFASPMAERLALWALAPASRVFARDPLSKEWLDSHGVGARGEESIDMAFRLPYRPMAAAEDDKVRIGINVSALLYSGGYGGGNSLGLKVDFKALAHRIIEWALGVPDAEVWLVPHVGSRDIPEEDDQRVAEALREAYPRLRIAGPFPGPSEAKSFLSSLRFFTGGRMHACIGAFSAGVPTVPLAYSRKFNGLFGSLGYPALVDCRAQTTEEAFATVVKGFSERAMLERAAAEGSTLALQKLAPYESCIRQALREAAAHG